jgi:hypothetical protein
MTDESATGLGVVPEVAAAAPERTLTPLQQQFLGIAGYLAALPRGPRAILRRLWQHGDEPPPDEFWQVVDRYRIPPQDELFWVAVLPLMIACPHAWLRPGDAVARAGVAKTRVERWLRLDQERACREANRLLARLDSGLDWTQFGPLLYHWGDEGRRRAFARQFFLSPALRNRGG